MAKPRAEHERADARHDAGLDRVPGRDQRDAAGRSREGRGRIEMSARRERREQQTPEGQRGEDNDANEKKGDEAVALPAIQSARRRAAMQPSWTEDIGEPLGIILRVGERLGRIEGHQLDVRAVGKARRQRDLRMRRDVALLERELLAVLGQQERDKGARGIRVLRSISGSRPARRSRTRLPWETRTRPARPSPFRGSP